MRKLSLVLALLLALCSTNAFAAKSGNTTTTNSTSQTCINNTTTLWVGYHATNTDIAAHTITVWSNASTTVTYIVVPGSSTVNVSFAESLGVPYIVVGTSMAVTHDHASLTSVMSWNTYR